MKMLCIGDSLVDGYPYSRGSSFPSVIGRITGMEVINAGISGQTSGEILARFPAELSRALGSGDEASGRDAVLILCGSNDFIFSVCGPEETMKNIRGMADAAEGYGRIILCSSPLCSPEQASRQWAEMDPSEYEEVNREITLLRDMLEAEAQRRRDTEFFDLLNMYSSFGLYVDGVHPVEEGYRLIGERIAGEFL